MHGIDGANNIFAGGGETGVLMHSLDWSQTLLGPVIEWPQTLKTVVPIILKSHSPMFVWWGRECITLYNDACRPILGKTKHPQFLGEPAKDCWADIWDVVEPLTELVFSTGQATEAENLMLVTERNGYLEEAYFTFSYSPIQDEGGGVGGIFCTVTETTKQILSERRLRTLRELSANTVALKSTLEVCQIALATLAENPQDIPFALLYELDGDSQGATLISSTGIELGTSSASPQYIDFEQNSADCWYLQEVIRKNQAELIESLTTKFSDLPLSIWGEPPNRALVMPIAQSGANRQTRRFLVLGISARRAFDDDYRVFFDMVANNIKIAIANANAYEEEHPRIQADYKSTNLSQFTADLASTFRSAIERTSLKLRAESSQFSESVYVEQQMWEKIILNLLSSAIIWIADCDGQLIAASGWEAFTGMTSEQYDAEGWLDAIHPEDRQVFVEGWYQALRSHTIYEAEPRLIHGSGHYRYVSFRAVPLLDAEHNVQEWIVAIKDINKRKRAEEALHASEEKFRVIVNQATVGIAQIDATGRIVLANQRLCDLLGYTSSEMLQKSVPDITHPDDLARNLELFQQLLDNGQEFSIEKRYIRKDGSTVWASSHVAATYNEQGQFRHAIAITLDISDRKRVEDERKRIEAERLELLAREQQARLEAEAANRVKDEFLAVLSHELRTPLNPIVGWSKLLIQHKYDESTTQKALETIHRNAELQTQLIADLLDVSRILQGKLTLDHHAVNLHEIIQASIETVNLAAEAKSIQINSHLQPRQAYIGKVLGDTARLQQILWNLLTNAIKFTPSGGRVDISLNYINAGVQIQVQDTGKGISPEFLPYVFDYFRQADSATTRAFGGLGLGLAIVRHLVELHGGTITAASDGEGKGATFTLTLPLLENNTPLQVPHSNSQSMVELVGMRILIVDDEPDSCEVISFALAQVGAVVAIAHSGAEALQTISLFKPDLIISDIGMPQMDGYMLIRQIRALPPEQGGQCYAIAVTAYAGEIDQKQAVEAGFQLHVPKPIDPQQLIKVISVVVQPQHST